MSRIKRYVVIAMAGVCYSYAEPCCTALLASRFKPFFLALLQELLKISIWDKGIFFSSPVGVARVSLKEVSRQAGLAGLTHLCIVHGVREYSGMHWKTPITTPGMAFAQCIKCFCQVLLPRT